MQTFNQHFTETGVKILAVYFADRTQVVTIDVQLQSNIVPRSTSRIELIIQWRHVITHVCVCVGVYVCVRVGVYVCVRVGVYVYACCATIACNDSTNKIHALIHDFLECVLFVTLYFPPCYPHPPC